MGLFSRRTPSPSPGPSSIGNSLDQIPVIPFDLTKRYDIYCTNGYQDLVYEGVRFISIRTFDRIYEYTATGYFEIEAADGTKMLIEKYGIRVICEHGTQPAFRVLKTYREYD